MIEITIWFIHSFSASAHKHPEQHFSGRSRLSRFKQHFPNHDLRFNYSYFVFYLCEKPSWGLSTSASLTTVQRVIIVEHIKIMQFTTALGFSPSSQK